MASRQHGSRSRFVSTTSYTPKLDLPASLLVLATRKRLVRSTGGVSFVQKVYVMKAELERKDSVALHLL